MPLVKVKDKFQVTIPVELREALHLAVGDILEATAEQDTIVLKPKAVVDRQQAWNQVIAVMERVHAKQQPSTKSPREAEEDIARDVKAFRKAHVKRTQRGH